MFDLHKDIYDSNLYHPIITGIASVKTCEEMWLGAGSRNLYNMCIFILLYTIPLLVMTTAYAKIGQTLWNGDRVLYINHK